MTAKCKQCGAEMTLGEHHLGPLGLGPMVLLGHCQSCDAFLCKAFKWKVSDRFMRSDFEHATIIDGHAEWQEGSGNE